MRNMFLVLGAVAGSSVLSPAAAFDPDLRDRTALLADRAFAPLPAWNRPGGRTFAVFEIGERAVSLAAYGRRARANMLGDGDEIRRARAMGKVFDGAPQPAFLTFEMRLHF